MKFGVREICDVVLKTKATQKIGNKIFYKNEPVIYFDTLKTSSLEGASTTVYAQGGKGNSRLVAWEGERTVTFTMEDALISPEGFMILSGAGLIEATKKNTIKQHMTETIDASRIEKEGSVVRIPLSHAPYFGEVDADDNLKPGQGNFAYVMFVRDGEIISEPYIPLHEADDDGDAIEIVDNEYVITVRAPHEIYNAFTKTEALKDAHDKDSYDFREPEEDDNFFSLAEGVFDSVIVDYYTARESGAKQIEITADKFGGNYYLEASTLFRAENGVDMPAEFIIPNCKVQSNFTFTMASSGDPSTFTFTMDAFPDFTRFDHSKKVLAAIQIIEEGSSQDLHRHSTHHEKEHDALFR